MKRLLHAAVACLGLAATSAFGGAVQADEILIYKYTSARPWTQYDCYHPDIASTPALPVIPLNARVGTYTQTEYWVFNKTQSTLQVVQYYSYVTNGATVKKYSVSAAEPLIRTAYDDNSMAVTIPGVRYLPALAANTFNVSINLGDGSNSTSVDLNSDGFNDVRSFTEQGNLTGLGKVYTVAPGIVFQKVASSMTGPYIYSDRSDYTSGSADVHSRSVYFEAGATQSVTLDAVATKSANTGTGLIPYGGGPALEKSTTAYGVRVVELMLEKLGYDNDDPPAGVDNTTVARK